MKRSLSIPMIYLGTLGVLSYCSNEPTTNTVVQVKQDFYASLEDCQRDWGNDPQNCRQALSTVNTNGQDSVTNGYTGSDANTAPRTATTSTSGGSSYISRYSGPRYFWYRNEYGGYPMTVDSYGNTHPVEGSRISESGAKFANQTVSIQNSMPTHMTASKGVIRSGFGSTGRGLSGGG